MKKIVGIIVCMVVVAILTGSIASACWMYLSVEEMQQQADLIVIGALTGDIREVVHKEGHGTTYWAIDVEYVLKGESGEKLEVATGGLVTKEPSVFISTDYRLDQYGELFILHLSKDEEGKYSPLTPRGIVKLERREGGVVLGTYDVVSDQHTDELSEIISFANENAKEPISIVLVEESSEPKSSKTPIFIGVGLMAMATIGFTMIRKQ